jgi:hypothetical protein
MADFRIPSPTLFRIFQPFFSGDVAAQSGQKISLQSAARATTSGIAASVRPSTGSR